MASSDADNVQKFHMKVMTDAANATSVALGKAGNMLGLYKAMGEMSEFDASQLAERTNTIERYVRDWLVNQAAAGYVCYDKATAKFYLNAAQKEVLTNELSPHYFASQFTVLAGIVDSALRFLPTEMRAGRGVPFGDHGPLYIGAISDSMASTYRQLLAQKWIPACITDERNKWLQFGGDTPLVVADLGCGYGTVTRLLAQTYAKQHLFVGLDSDEQSIQTCEKSAAEEALDNCLFAKSDVHHIPAPRTVEKLEQLWKQRTDKPVKEFYDVVLCVNTLHDLQDPLAVLLSVRERLEPHDGVLVLVEPLAKEPIEANFDLAGQFLSAASVTWCMPCGMCPRDDGQAKSSTNLGALSPDASYFELLKQAGFSRCSKVQSEVLRVFAIQV